MHLFFNRPCFSAEDITAEEWTLIRKSEEEDRRFQEQAEQQLREAERLSKEDEDRRHEMQRVAESKRKEFSTAKAD